LDTPSYSYRHTKLSLYVNFTSLHALRQQKSHHRSVLFSGAFGQWSRQFARVTVLSLIKIQFSAANITCEVS